MPKRLRENGRRLSAPSEFAPELALEAESDSDAVSDISETEIERAITAALKGEVLVDEDLDSDALVPLSDEEDDDEEEEEEEHDAVNTKNNRTNGASIDAVEDEEELSEDPDEDDEDPDEGEIDAYEGSDSGTGSDDDNSLFSVVQGADGLPRRMRPEIEAGYESDSSTEDTTAGGMNTVGDIDMSLYDRMPHMGYDINGKRIMRPAVGKALDSLLETMDGNQGYTGVSDRNTGLDVKLSEAELDIIKRIRRAEMPDADYNAYEDYVDYFSGVLQETPISSRPEPKSRFVPSKWEQKRVVKIVRAIREGRIVPNRPKTTERTAQQDYDIWKDEVAVPDHIMNIPAPKMSLPTHAESYNPPAEYLPSQEEIDAWEAMDPDDRPRDYLPKKYSSLRLVPGYADVIKERFGRCLDLYKAPRIRRNKLNIDPESLVPKLPSPQDLRPFPSRCAHIMKDHTGRVRCLDVSPDGIWLATGSDDASLKIWEILTGRCVKTIKEFDGEVIHACKWNPNPELALLAVSAGDNCYLICPTTLVSEEVEDVTRETCQAGYAYQAQNSTTATTKEPACKWLRSTDKQNDQGVLMVLATKQQVKQIDWHRRGDYFSTVSPDTPSRVLIHQLSKHTSQSPFSKSKGAVQCVEFHPTRPVLFVASQRYVRIYNLQKQELQRTLQSGVRWISSMSVHPGGDNVIIGSYDKKMAWFDTDLSPRPYRTLKYHAKAVRSVQYHTKYPLFASASDDGTIQVFHGMVYNDLNQNALIVPLKILKGHQVQASLGVLACCWHTRQPWLFSAGADGTVRMWT